MACGWRMGAFPRRVVLATGVQPNSRLAAQRRAVPAGIVVDRQMAASLPGISAIGECCEIDGQTWGWWPCLRQAEVLADRLCGVPGEGFVWQDAGTRLKVTGIELFSAGEQQAGEQDDIYTSWDPSTATIVACCCATAACAACC
jgi:nitrite reductase (NADH) large subunit